MPFFYSIKKRFSFPKRKQWKKFFELLSRKEKIIFFSFLALAVFSLFFLLVNYYFANTAIKPANGGEIIEGSIGQPRFINPLYLSDNDIDRDIVELVFSGFFKYDNDGKIINDLAESYKIENQGKDYHIKLKDNLLWQDGKPLTADDVIFTMKILQTPQYKSPSRIEWFGINVEKISDREIVFHLQKSYRPFIGKLAKIKILPKHILENISPDNFPWIFNKKQYIIGSGPFYVKEIKKGENGENIHKIILEKNKNYYGKKPFLDRFSFIFYNNFNNLLEAVKKREINAFSIPNPTYNQIIEKEGFKKYQVSLPRYFALFFNLRNKDSLLSKSYMRESIAFLINKEEILKKVFNDQGEIVSSPILSNYFGFRHPEKPKEYNPQKAINILEENGFKLNKKTGFREKTIEGKTFLFKRNLTIGSKGEEVRKLQECLAKFKDIYPDGDITGYFGKKTKEAVVKFQEKYASEILAPIGLKKGTGDVKPMTRKKLNQICQEKPKIIPLTITIATSDKFPLKEISGLLKKQLEKYGFNVVIDKISLTDLQSDVLVKRKFEALLFGEVLDSIPDPFPFWHSSQKNYPGLNITGYQSKTADSYLEKARESLSPEESKKYLEKFQNILLKETPAIFLVQPRYTYFLSPQIKGLEVKKASDQSERFSQIENVYIKTSRKWK